MEAVIKEFFGGDVPSPESPAPRYPVINCIEISSEQDRTLHNEGQIYLENMERADSGRFSAYVFLSDDGGKIFSAKPTPKNSSNMVITKCVCGIKNRLKKD
jgi:hypothetical protein